MLTRKKLREVLHYDPMTGVWTWLLARGRLAKAGQQAGNINKVDGRRRIVVDGVAYLAHRLAWFYVKGRWPVREIDHVDTNFQNDRWNNLRLATHAQNQTNSRKYKTNKSGFKGVSWKEQRGAWVVQGQHNKKKFHLGYFDQPELGAIAYEKFAIANHKAFARVS